MAATLNINFIITQGRTVDAVERSVEQSSSRASIADPCWTGWRFVTLAALSIHNRESSQSCVCVPMCVSLLHFLFVSAEEAETLLFSFSDRGWTGHGFSFILFFMFQLNRLRPFLWLLLKRRQSFSLYFYAWCVWINVPPLIISALAGDLRLLRARCECA